MSQSERIGYVVDENGRTLVPDAPCFCLFCGQDYRMALPPSDAPTPIIGPCCAESEAAKRFQKLTVEIMGGKR